MAKRKADELQVEFEALKKENSELKSLLKSEKKRNKKATSVEAINKDILLKLHDFSLKLAYLPSNELFSFITSQIKSIFNVRAALINTYDETTSELVLQYTTLSNKENAKLIKVLGGKLLNRRTPVNKKDYKRITSKVYEQIPSLHELTFGAVPELICKTIEKIFGVEWFTALGLIHNKKLVGTMILAGDKKQHYPEKETILAFAGITANALARKKAEDELSQTEKRYKNIVNSSPYGMHMYELQEDDKLVFIGANPASDRILGFEHSSIIGLLIEEAFPSLIDTEVPSRYKEVIKKNAVWKTEQINYKDEKVVGAFEVFAFRIAENQMVARFLEITERIQKEQTLKQSQENLAITLRSIGDGVISTDKLGRVTNMNPVAEELCGWKLENAIGKPLDKVFVIVDASTKIKLSNPVENVISTGKVVELSNHTVLISKDGTERNVSDSAAPIIDNDNNIQGVVLVFSDVTEKYNAREEIKAREQRAVKHRKALTELATNKVIASGDIQNAKKLLTEIAAEALEVERCSLWLMSNDNTQMKCIDLFESSKHKHSEGTIILYEECPTYFKEVTENSLLAITDVKNDPRSIELFESYLLPLGIVSMLDSKVPDDDGGFGGVVCFEHKGKKRQWYPAEEAFATTIASYLVQIISVSRKKEADAALKEEKERISTILNLVGDPIFVKDNQHRFILCNKAFYKMVGLDENNVIGKTLAEGIPVDEMEHFLKVDRLVLDTGILDIREEVLTVNNETKTILTSKTRFIDNVGNKCLIGSIHDISERIKAEKELAHFNELMKFVISNTKSSVSVYDTEMNYIYVSDRYYDDFHLTDKNIIGRNHYDVFPDLPQFLRDIHKRALIGETISGQEDLLIHIDGTEDWANWTCMPWYKSDSTIGGIIIYIEVITDRIKTSASLKESEEKFRGLAENVPGVIYLCKNDERRSMIYLNDAVENLTGYSKEEFLLDKISFADLYYPEDKEYIYKEVETALKNNLQFKIEYKILDKNKTIKWIEEIGAKLINQNNVEYIEGFLSDITERKKAEEQITLLAQMVNIAPGGIIVHDFEGQILYANQRAAQMHGCTSEEFLALSLRDIDIPETAELIQTRMNDLALFGEINFEGGHRRKDGTAYPVQVYAKRILWAGKQAILSITTDITERKMAEETLRQSEDRFRKAIAGTGAGLWDWDMVNNKVYYSTQWKNMLGYEDNEIENNFSGWKNLWHPDESAIIEKAIEDYLSERTRIYEVVHRLKHKDGSWHWILTRGDIHKEPSGKPVRWIGTNLDITERKRAEEELIISKEKVEEINANVTAILDGTSDSIWAFDLNYNILYINNAFQKDFNEAFGVWLEKGSNLINALPEFLRQFWITRYQRVLSNEQFTIVDEVETAIGKLFIQVTFNPIIKNGAVIGGSCFGSNITERRRAEEKIRESEQQFRSLFDNAADAIFIADAESGIIVNANHSAEKMLGDSLENIVGKHQSELHPPEIKNYSQDSFMKHKREADELKLTNLVESNVLNSSGSQIPVEVIASKVQYQGRNCIMGIFRDITERKRAEEAFQKINRQFKMVWEKSTDGMRLTTDDGKIVAVNDSFCRMVGKREEELIGYDLSVIYGDEQKEHVISQYIENFNARTFIPVTVRETELWNGKKIWFDVSISLLEFDGKSPLLLGVFREITERRKAEKALRESEEQYRTLVENLNEAVMLVDNDDTVLFVNNKFTELLGYSKYEIVGKIGYEILIPHEERKLIIEANADRKKGKSGQYEVTFLSKTGDLRNFLINGSPVYNADGHVIGSLGALTDITERKKSEEELERIKIQLIETIKQSPLPMVLASAEDFKLKIINKATEDFLLIDANNYLEKSLFDVDVVWKEYTPEGEVVLPIELPLPRALQGLFTHNKEMRLERKDGSSVWQLASGAPIFNSKGKLIAGLLVMQDISNIKLAEEALKKSEAEFRNLFESANDSILIFEPDSEIILEINNKTCEIYGFEKEELIGMSLKSLTKDVDKGVKHIEQTLKNGRFGNFETEQINKNGDTIYLLCNASVIEYMGRNAILSINRNITDRKRAEKVQEILYNIALHIHLEKSTKELLEFVRNEIGNVIDTTNFFAAIYNPEKDTLKEIIYVDEIDKFENDEWSASQSISGHVVKEGKTVFLRGDEIDEFYKDHNLGLEGTIPKSWIGVPIFSNTRAIGIMVIQNYVNYSAFSNSDVTMLEMIAHEIGVFIEKHTMIDELVKAKDKAEEMNKVKSNFFANMSHELRTPFVGIMGYAELLADSLEKEDEKLMAEGILKASSRMQDTLANILNLSKLEAESIEIRKEKVEVNALITNLFESFKGGALRKNLSFEKDINFKELVVETDEIILKDILQNFVSNAIKYTNKGFVKLRADIDKSDLLVIEVKDSGLGIPKDKLELIWEPFRQVSEGLNRSFEGTGLGLSIVKKSAELLGGNVKVESEYGKGSSFKILLPITQSL